MFKKFNEDNWVTKEPNCNRGFKMVEITMKQFLEKGKELYGEEKHKWKFKCTNCKRIQSILEIQIQLEREIKPKRFPDLTIDDEHDISPHTTCYSDKCNWVSNGLFNSGLLLIYDEKEPHNSSLKNNCIYVFPFADFDFNMGNK
jgi:hypothetical protein